MSSAGAAHTAVGESRPPERREGPRLSFRVKVALVWVGIFIVLGLFLWAAKFDWTWIGDNYLYILKGVKVTLILAISAIVLAVLLALLGSLGRLSRNPVSYGISGFYTSFFRGTPLIVQLFLIYFAVPQVARGLGLDASHPAIYKLSILSVPATGVIGLGLNYGAYMTEIFRAGILSVGGGQTEAAEALGMTFPQRMRRVILPQAFKVVIPPTANEFIAMTKDTALVLFLGGTLQWYDLFARARTLGTLDNKPLEALIIAAAIYWLLTIILTFFQTKLERRINRAYQRTTGVPARSKLLSVAAPAAGGHDLLLTGEPEVPPEPDEGPP